MESRYASERPERGIAVDASHLASKGITEYQGVDIETGKVLFRQNLGNQTVNIGEFLAIVHAVHYIIENCYEPRVVYSDSMVALSWFRKKRTASTKPSPMLKKAEIFLKALECDIENIDVRFWDNREYGETPADFGRK